MPELVEMMETGNLDYEVEQSVNRTIPNQEDHENKGTKLPMPQEDKNSAKGTKTNENDLENKDNKLPLSQEEKKSECEK